MDTGGPVNESWYSPSTIIAILVLLMVSGTIVGVFLKGDAPMMNTIAGLVVGSGIGSVTGYYFGSSKGSAVKDKILADKIPPTQ